MEFTKIWKASKTYLHIFATFWEFLLCPFHAFNLNCYYSKMVVVLTFIVTRFGSVLYLSVQE